MGLKVSTLIAVNRAIVSCARCPRLRAYCRRVARDKKREFRAWTYWGKPVPGFGDPDARLLVVGLAPAAHGANRTGRMFTGDSSGNWLYEALYRHGFASQPQSLARDDGLTLIDCYISAAARCAPPGNKPSHVELERCRPYIAAELRLLQRVRVVGAAPVARAASVRPRRGDDAARRVRGHRVVPPEPAKHQHRQAHARDVGSGIPDGRPAARSAEGVGYGRSSDDGSGGRTGRQIVPAHWSVSSKVFPMLNRSTQSRRARSLSAQMTVCCTSTEDHWPNSL